MPTAHSLSPSDLDTLEALARAATPGKRELHEHLITETSVCIPNGPTDCRGLGSIELGYADTELAVACDPETILALVAMARRAPGWIPSDERLPDEDRTVLMYAHASNDDPHCFNIPDGGVHWVGAASFEEGSFFELWDEDSLYPLRVTHWQPLPAPPEEKP